MSWWFRWCCGGLEYDFQIPHSTELTSAIRILTFERLLVSFEMFIIQQSSLYGEIMVLDWTYVTSDRCKKVFRQRGHGSVLLKMRTVRNTAISLRSLSFRLDRSICRLQECSMKFSVKLICSPNPVSKKYAPSDSGRCSHHLSVFQYFEYKSQMVKRTVDDGWSCKGCLVWALPPRVRYLTSEYAYLLWWSISWL